MKALIVEDDPEIVESVSLAFQMGWPEAQLVSTHLGKKGLEMAETESPTIIILDLGLPDVGGFEVLKQIRLFSSVPIIILTAKTDESNIVKGLEWGADDFIVKPCGQLELPGKNQGQKPRQKQPPRRIPDIIRRAALQPAFPTAHEWSP